MRDSVCRRPLMSSFLMVTLLCGLSVLFFDQPLARYYREAANAETVAVFRFITHLGDATPYLIAVFAILVGCGIAATFSLYQATSAAIRGVTQACVLILLSLAASGMMIHVIKFSMGRYRPQGLFESGLYDIAMFTTGYLNSSFPSGHSQVAGALAASLALVASQYTLFYVMFALLVGYSRVVTGDHYLSDVIFGLFLGAASAVLIKQWVYERRGIPLTVALPGEGAPAGTAAAPSLARLLKLKGSKQTHLPKTGVALARDDDVVMENNPDPLQRLLDQSRHLDVRG